MEPRGPFCFLPASDMTPYKLGQTALSEVVEIAAGGALDRGVSVILSGAKNL